MKTVFLLFFVLFPVLFSHAEVRMESFYFIESNSTLTSESKQKLDDLKFSIENMQFQVIEVNGFSDFEGANASNYLLSKKRADVILNFLEAVREEVTINIYGKKRVKVDFVPKHWNRVDVYFFVKEKLQIEDVDNKVQVVESKVIEKKVYKIPEKENIVKKVPVILPIRFKEGTIKIKQASKEYLDHLYETMMMYPELNMHIRGHVCCYNKIGASKKRAKAVYKYLIEKGISKKRMTFAGYGNTLPLYFPERYKSDREANRRVDVIFDKEIPQEHFNKN